MGLIIALPSPLTTILFTHAFLPQVAESLRERGAQDAVTLRVAEQYLSGFKELARASTTVVLPADVGSPASMVTQVQFPVPCALFCESCASFFILLHLTSGCY